MTGCNSPVKYIEKNNKAVAGMKKIIQAEGKELLPYEKHYNYQPELTEKLDKMEGSFSQEMINEIVLWKVNRYVKMTDETLLMLNKIDRLNNDEEKELFTMMLNTDGIDIPMMSTILRFRNPERYQIIDQRAYRVLYGEEYHKPTAIDKKIELYCAYLKELRAFCKRNKIPFSKADRIMYEFDKKENAGIPIKY